MAAGRNPELSKKKILEAGEACFAQKGFFGARVDEIAALSGVNKRMIYAYFGKKEALYLAVLEQVYRRMQLLELDCIDEEGDCKDAVRGVIRSNFTFLYQNPSVVKIMMWENLNEAWFAKQVSLHAIKQPVYDKIRRILQRGVREGVFRSDIDVESVVFDTIAFSFSYFSNRFTLAEIFETDYSSEEQIQRRIGHICDCVLGYLCGER